LNNGSHFLSLLFTGNWPRANQDKFFFFGWMKIMAKPDAAESKRCWRRS
jgi:hypothetical protein